MSTRLSRLSLATVLGCSVITSSACRPEPGAELTIRPEPWPSPEVTLIWHGTGQAHRKTDGGWERTPAQDYEFTVVQRRYPERWESTKTMFRRHPDYDGAAGPREQSLHFTLLYRGTQFAVQSSLGEGTGKTDSEFRSATMNMDANVGRMAPFDRYRIEQRYLYEQGRLEETVSLNDGDSPWVRIDETAQLFATQSFDAPPSRVGSR